MCGFDHANQQARCECHSCTQSRRPQFERALEEITQTKTSAKIRLADDLAKAAEPLVNSFLAMKNDHHAKLVEGQSFETASKNFFDLLQEPLDFGPLIQALEAYKQV